MFNALHGAITIRLFFDKDRMGIQSPLFSTKVRLERLKKSVGVLWRNTRNVPLTYQTSSRIDETHGEILYTDVNTQDQRHPFIKDLETFK
jgi:hypothetical protein